MESEESALESVEGMSKLSNYRGKTVLVTGHTGFKGTWMCKLLTMAGANVIGYSMAPPTNPNLYGLSGLDSEIESVIADIRDLDSLRNTIISHRPEIVIHMAAQPIVREGYKNPVFTYETNVMGTVHICEAIRTCGSVKSFVNVTTDKVYHNREWVWGYREEDSLNGFDPYSNSKSCSELVTDSYRNSFFDQLNIAVSTCRAGNVIGGGDFAADRILPDCVRAMERKEVITVRNPSSTRPYQHVLEPVCAYLMIALRQIEDRKKYSGSFNVGPDECDCVTTGELTELFTGLWGDGAAWQTESEEHAPHEAGFLKLDCSKLKAVYGWHPIWHIEEAVAKTVEWSKIYLAGGNTAACMEHQIEDYWKAAYNITSGGETE